MGCLGQRYLSSWAVAWPRSARFALACQNSVGRQLTARYAPDAAAARWGHLVVYGDSSPTVSTAYAGSERSLVSVATGGAAAHPCWPLAGQCHKLGDLPQNRLGSKRPRSNVGDAPVAI